MKRILLSLGLSLFCFFAISQRSLDLELSLDSPLDGVTIETLENFNLVVNVKNNGNIDLESADSVYYYMLIYSDTVPFPQTSHNYLTYTGTLSQPSESFTISRQMAFNDQFADMIVDLCIYVKPMNGVNPLSDPNQSNNMDCISINVVANSLSVKNHELEGVQLSPNPANTSFSMEGLGENTKVNVIDINGKQIDFISDLTNKINCSTWTNGVYLVNVTTEAGTFVKRLIVSH